jgi:hypothetical protein
MKSYTTSDTAEAAYLMANGAKFVRTEKDILEDKSNIILEGGYAEQIDELLPDWKNKQCPEYDFFMKYKFLLKKVMNGN